MTIFIRRSVSTADAWDPYMLAYARAVHELRRRDEVSPAPGSDPTSWSYQAAMHGTYATAEPQWHWNGCQHASWFFLPWHRMYIAYFELIVRSIVTTTGGPADWALPYWNWTANPRLPWAFRQEELPAGTLADGTTANPLYTPRRNALPAPGINGGAPLPTDATEIAYALGFTSYDSEWRISPGVPEDKQPPQYDPGFGGGPIATPTQFAGVTGGFEDQPHNVIHDLIGGVESGQCAGGLMCDPRCAALDPIFWLHHSNIDRVWVEWLALGGDHVNPVDPHWLGQRFHFFGPDRGPQSKVVRQVLDTAALGYRYDVPPVVAQPLHLVAAMAAREPAPAAAGTAETIGSLEAVRLGAGTASVAMPLQAAADEAVELLAAPDTGPSAVYLVLDDIQVRSHPGFVYGIYLNVPEAGEPAAASAHRVGFLSFFGLTHGHGEGHDHPLRRSFRITSLVYDLRARGLWDPAAVTIAFRPVGLEGDGPLVAEGAEPDVEVGRVRVVTV